MVAIWHVRDGLVRCWFSSDGCWIRPDKSFGAQTIPDREVLGWWPDPKPIPDIECKCHGCGKTMSVPIAPHPSSGTPGPALDAAPEGWRYTVVRKSTLPFTGVLIPFMGWLCPTCPLPENPDG